MSEKRKCPDQHPALKRTWWINLYPDGQCTGTLCETREIAKNRCTYTGDHPDAEQIEIYIVPVSHNLDGATSVRVQPDGYSRSSFEMWVTQPPYERDIYRWPMDETKHAWPGQYKDIAVQLAWEAWQEAQNYGGQR